MLKNIQALRAFAALSVALSHLVTYNPALAFLGPGTLGVEVFFVISGFIMVHITMERAPAPRSFMINRIVRVVPLYWLLTITVFTLAALAPALFKATRANPVELLESLLFIPFVKSDGGMRPLLFQGWTLNFEMLFYLGFAMALMLRQPARRVAVMSLAIVLVVAAGPLLAPLSPVARFYSSPVILCFAFGMGLALVQPRIDPGHVGIALVVVLVLGLLFWRGDLPEAGIPYLRVAFAVSVVAAALAFERSGRTLAWAPVQALGAASYSLYLIHPFPALAIEQIGRRAGLLDGATLAPVVIIAVAAMIASGVALHRWVELPLQHGAKRLLAGSPHKGG